MLKDFIVSTIMTIVTFYVWNSYAENKFSWCTFRIWIFVLIASTLTLINFYNVNNIFRVINLMLIFIVLYKFLYKVQLRRSIASSVLIQLLYLISESLFAIIMLSFFKGNMKDFLETFVGTIFTNISICLFVLFLSKVNIVKKIYYIFYNYISRMNEINVIFVNCMVMLFYTIFAVNTYKNLNSSVLMIISLIILSLSSTLVLLFFKSKDDYYKMSDRYNSSLLSLKELEKVLTNYRIDNHENKNQLMTIRNMTRSKKITDFIDTIVNNQLKDDKRIMKETSIIPAGGLRGLVYSKLLLMNSKDIDYELDVASSVRIVDILDFGDETMLDVCKVIGIFLDNAIEEVDTIDDKYIVIEMYNDEDVFTISITNTYDNTKDKKDIYKAGVSTKGGNHGYGLSLVKKIIKNNSKLETSNEITENEFTQVLNIKK